jgi:hypothetical protein
MGRRGDGDYIGLEDLTITATPAPRRARSLCDRPPRVGTVWLAQEAEPFWAAYSKHLIGLRRGRREAVFLFALRDQGMRTGRCPFLDYSRGAKAAIDVGFRGNRGHYVQRMLNQVRCIAVSKTRQRVRSSCNSSERRTLNCMTYTQRLLNKIPPPTIQLFISLSIIAAIAIIGFVLVTL